MVFEIIPAIDLRAGRCVRLSQGDFSRETVYGDDPVEMARRWEGQGAPRLHVVDLDASRSGRPVNLEWIRRIAGAVQIPVQTGGGIRDPEAVLRVLDAGAERAVVGSAAAQDPDRAAELFAEFGERLILGLDAREGKIAVAGWETTTDWSAEALAGALAGAGVRRVIYTDIATDGMETGPNLDATRRLARSSGLAVIASGGVGSVQHLRESAALAVEGVEGVIVGRALYTGAVRLDEALAAVGRVPVRRRKEAG